MLFHLIPILRLRTIFVRCGACAQDMVAKCSLEEVARDNPMILRDLLVKRISFVGKVCIVLGLLLCWAPLIGVLPATIGFFYRNAYGRLMKAMSYIGLIISWLITGSLAILSVLSKH